MKLYTVKLILSILLTVFVVGVSAQGFRSSYFLDGATFRHQMNPAFMGERNYVSIPVLGNMNIGVQGNVGLSDFIYKYDHPKYDLTTFLNSSVGREEFLDKLHTNNKINANINLTILSFGFHKWGGFNTFEIGLKSNTSINMPYELFNFMKTGMDKLEGSEYHIKDFAMRSNNYVELALGHARPVNDKLTVGGKLKILFGGANADAKFDRMDIKMSENEWVINAYGKVDASIKGGSFETRNPNEDGMREIKGFDVESPGIGGLGLGIDLGATYKLRDDLTLSAAVIDLGFISWKNSLRGYNNGTPYTFKGFTDIEIDPDKESPNYNGGDLEDQFDQMKDDLEDIVKFYDHGDGGRRGTMLATTINLGAEYIFPYYDKLSFGLLSSTRINKPYTWTEARLSANVSPIDWFQASVNYGISNFGSSLGWMLNFHPKGFNFFIGFDHMFTKITPQFVPVNNANMQVSLGFNITFGGAKKSTLALNR